MWAMRGKEYVMYRMIARAARGIHTRGKGKKAARKCVFLISRDCRYLWVSWSLMWWLLCSWR